MKKRLIYVQFLLMIITGITFSQENSVQTDDIYPGEISIKGFSLSQSTDVTIEGTFAMYDSWEHNTFFYAWIIRSDNRKVVWHLLNDYDPDDEGEHEIKTTVGLREGDYELYYAGSYDYGTEINNLGDLLDKIFSGKSEKRRRARRDYHIKVYAPGKILAERDPYELVDNYTKDALIAVNRVGNYENIEKRFSLSRETDVRIYGLGEGRGNSIFDYAWIYNPVTNEKVWQMDPRRGRYAGGGEKNLYYDDEITLPKGNYILTYVTDDSHAFGNWNVMPPEDPQFWGVTLFPVNPADKKNLEEFDEEIIPNPVISINKVWDNEYISQGFELEESMDIRILALGEGDDGRLADYGWIINAETRETIWDMNREKTEFAGGATKNRMVDETIRLEEGKYIVFYKTDGSHSFEEWNSTPPFLKDKWGITIWTADKNDEDRVTLFSERDYKNENVLAQITRVRDDEDIERLFSLNGDTRLRIIAVGEGDRQGMFDFGWIKNEVSGRIVWDMTYRKTTHAGGAKKNRLFNDVIILPAGEYSLHYKTDDSHSYRDWNSSPPDDEEMYGITIFYEK
ncbi:MAG: hypothetical protein SCALA702_17240 [Melioribacteraceae bacterium]|nr:MAG: hypothetical protein SCALA702_17240 [Melioribacteraceae bacterium]